MKGIGFVAIYAVSRQSFGYCRCGYSVFISERLDCCDSDIVSIDFKKFAQLCSCAASTKAICTQSYIMLRDKCPDLLSIVGDIVGGSDDGAFSLLQALRYVAGFLYFLLMERVPA